ncbi:MAG TPA: DNA polymerase III subunit chi [Allosphingosinicella sp.]
MIVNFYHLASTPLERVLPLVCQGLVGQGERMLVVGDEALIARLDEQLWTFAADSFVPHGRERAEAQPVLLSTEPVAANGARAIALAGGEWREEALGFDKAYVFFGDEGLDAARGLWRTLKGNKAVEPRYWKQVDGKWVQGP